MGWKAGTRFRTTGRTRFLRWLALWTCAGLVIRVLSVIGRPDQALGGDATFYNGAANLLVQGKGFINAVDFYWLGHSQPSAAYPPGFILMLAVAPLAGFTTAFAHRIWCAILGSIAVAVCGLAGRQVGGDRVGLVTAFMAAISPNIWMSDQMALSETVVPLVVALVLLSAYRFWRSPGLKAGIWFGLAIGVAVLTRDELSLLGPVVLLPMVVRSPGLSWTRRLGIVAAAGACALLVVGPWIGYNMSRFKDPVYISTGLGPTLASTDCAQTWSGPLIGSWSFACESEAPFSASLDESQNSAAAKTFALSYVRSHESRIPVVALARVGRGLALFHPIQQVDLDAAEGRPIHWALTGLWIYYALLALAVPGTFVLVKRGVTVIPLAGVGLSVVVSMILSFGNTRYRTPFEVCLLILAAVAVDRFWTRVGAGAVADRADVTP